MTTTRTLSASTSFDAKADSWAAWMGKSTYAVGDILYASGAFTLSKLAGVATGNALISGGVTTAPAWGKIGLTTHISGTLAVGNGGIGVATLATGQLIKGNGTSAVSASIIYDDGTNITIAGTLGYRTGTGGAVTQATSRTTGVTLNKINGAITLFTDAGSATAASFTVTNSTVEATDVIIINQKSGTNKYNAIVTAIGAGSFEVTFYTTGGTASDAPVFNFAVFKAKAS